MWGYQQNYQQYQQPYQQPVQKQFYGRWLMAHSYNDVQSIPVPADGTPTLIMLDGESTFYVVTMENGRRMITGYNFAALAPATATPTTDKSSIDSLNDRMTKLEALIGGLKNESNIQPATTGTASTINVTK